MFDDVDDDDVVVGDDVVILFCWPAACVEGGLPRRLIRLEVHLETAPLQHPAFLSAWTYDDGTWYR